MPIIDATSLPRPPRRPFGTPRGLRAAAALLVAFGLGGAAVHMADGRGRVTVLAMSPGPVSAMKDGDAAAVTGQVTDVFGKSFVVADETGKALVDTGPSGEGATLVKPGETVTVQGRFDRGALHAAVLSHADGRRDALDPGPGGHLHPPGPRWLRAVF